MDVFTVAVTAAQSLTWACLGYFLYKIAGLRQRIDVFETRLTMATAPRVAYPVPLEDPRYP